LGEFCLKSQSHIKDKKKKRMKNETHKGFRIWSMRLTHWLQSTKELIGPWALHTHKITFAIFMPCAPRMLCANTKGCFSIPFHLLLCMSTFLFIFGDVFTYHDVFFCEYYLNYAHFEGEKNTRREGWIVLAFSSLKTEVTDQKLIEFRFWCNVQNLNAADK